MNGGSAMKCFSITFGYTPRPSYYIQEQIQDAINGRKPSGMLQTLVGGVIQSTLKPLGGSYDAGFMTSLIT